MLTNGDFLVHQPSPVPAQELISFGAHRVQIADFSAAVDEIMGLASDAQAFGDPGDAGLPVMTPVLEAMTAHHGSLEILAGFASLQPQQHEVAFIL